MKDKCKGYGIGNEEYCKGIIFRPVIQASRHGLRLNPRLGERFDQSALFFGSVI